MSAAVAGERDTFDHLRSVDADAFAETDEELGMRDVAARDATGLLLVQALRELDTLSGIGTARVQRAHGERKRAHLEEELHHERAESGAREPPVGDAKPERMAAERPARRDLRPQILDERAAARHQLEPAPASRHMKRLLTPSMSSWPMTLKPRGRLATACGAPASFAGGRRRCSRRGRLRTGSCRGGQVDAQPAVPPRGSVRRE
jgi:hypothetical protein